jgi:endothelin-converting enzyme/putative endopeptidase
MHIPLAFLTTLILLVTFSAAATEPQLPYSPSLDLSSMNKQVQPCQDFYQYACGGWIQKNPIPGDQASWDVYSKLALDNEKFIRALLEEAAKPSATRSPAQQKIGDYYRACMDEPAIEKADLKPLKERLDSIAAIQSLADFSKVLAQEHLVGLGHGTLFSISSDQDYGDSQSVIAFANRAGLGLPDRDYYTKTDKKSVEIRAKYVEHLRQSFELLGDSKALAGPEAEQVLALETKLAKAMLTRVELRDPRKLFHKMPLAKFKALVPAIDWNTYLQTLGLDHTDVINVTEPKYYSEIQKLLKAVPLAHWRLLLRWNLVHNAAPYLSSRFVNSDFEFYQKYLHGTKELRPRWRRCAAWTDDALGEALGQVFVAKTFAPETKARTVAMTNRIEEAMAAELKTLTWMTESTRRQAEQKLHTLVNKVGYPDKWRDYSSLTIKPEDFSGNVWRADAFENHRQLAKIGKPLDRTEWGMTPPTVNAYYNPQMNDINFPAGVLQPPLFDPKMDDAPNYGNTGATIGHELTHGFDDEGRKFDAKGNLKDWWTKKDAQEFERRAKCVSDQYSGYIAVDDIHINGKLTNGEDIADLGGTWLAYLAWKRATEGQTLKPIDGLSPEQRFFIGMAQWACGDVRPESKRDRAITDPHSPLADRVNGVVANLPEFAAAFKCQKGQPMVREKVCRIW